MAQRRRLDIKAILIGFLLDTLCTIAVSVVLISAMSAAGIPEAEIVARIRTPSGILLSLIYGLGCTAFGGYVAGRIAKHDEIRHGAVVAGISLLLGIVLREKSTSLWYDIAGYLLIIPAGMFGGLRAAKHRRKHPVVRD